MPESLSVDLNQGRLHDVSVAPDYTTSDSFVVNLVNHGESVHVHLHLDDDLSSVARLSAGNHFVEASSTRPVDVEVAPVDEPVTGKLKVVTGYGSETAYVDVTVEPPVEEKPSVTVDESLSKPPRREPEPDPIVNVAEFAARLRHALPVLILGLLAIALALAVGYYVDSSTVLLGAGVVIGGAVVAMLFALR